MWIWTAMQLYYKHTQPYVNVGKKSNTWTCVRLENPFKTVGGSDVMFLAGVHWRYRWEMKPEVRVFVHSWSCTALPLHALPFKSANQCSLDFSNPFCYGFLVTFSNLMLLVKCVTRPDIGIIELSVSQVDALVPRIWGQVRTMQRHSGYTFPFLHVCFTQCQWSG